MRECPNCGVDNSEPAENCRFCKQEMGERAAQCPSDATDCSVSSARREVIENKLLDALIDEGTVAILASESDLNLFIESLGLAVHMEKPGAIEMQRDLMQLRDAAFSQNAAVSHGDRERQPEPSPNDL